MTYSHSGKKTVADSVEALIGAYFRYGSELHALKIMEFLGILTTNGLEMASRGKQFICSPKRTISNPRQESMKFENLERALNYRFRDWSILEEALQHGTYVERVDSEATSNMRISFLGDAVLEVRNVFTMKYLKMDSKSYESI